MITNKMSLIRNLLLTFLVFLTINVFSQRNEEYIKYIEQLKSNTISDKNDKEVLNILNEFYEQALQSDKGELDPNIAEKIKKLYEDKDAKNLHILNMFLAYQDYISQSTAKGQNPNAKFQLNLITDLENETKETYGEVPIIIKIYKAEALNSNGQTKESAELINQSLSEFPNSIPLKVYRYLNTKDENIKDDLIKNHSNHWMVQQFGIK